MDCKSEICNGIKELRKNSKMSQRQFANYFDIPVATYQDWEHGRRTPPRYLFEMMKKIYDYELKRKDGCDE